MKSTSMGKPRSFKTRAAWTLFGFGALPALILAAGAYIFEHSTESFLVHSTLQDEIKELIAHPVRVQRQPQRGLTDVFWKGYPASPAPASLPPHIKQLQPGYHDDVRWAGHETFILVADTADGRAYAGFDVSAMERKEFWFSVLLGITILGVMSLAAWFARRAADSLSRPLEALDASLAQFNPSGRGQRIPSIPDTPELDIVVDSINDLLARMETFIEHEQRFAKTASHELRTPLTVISGAMEIARERYGRTDPVLQRIDRAIGEMRDTTESLLALSRESSHLRGRCRLETLLPVWVGEYKRLTAGSAVQLTVGHLEPCPVAAPERLVSITVGNLLRNAIQHTEKGRIRVGVAGGRLSVADTGRGMPPAMVKTLRGPENSIPASNSGNGLGLYIVNQICRRYGWLLDIKSELGSGTTVTVTFQS